MELPRWLIGLFDPAAREFDRDDRRQRHPRLRHDQGFQGGAVMGPGIPGGARQATGEELAALSAEAAGHRADRAARLARIQADHEPQLRAAAAQVLAHGRARLTLPTVTLDAELLTFWRGDRLLRIEHAATDGSSQGSSLTRFPRHDRPDSEDVVTAYLAAAAAQA